MSKNFWVQKYFRSEKISSPKKIGSEKILAPFLRKRVKSGGQGGEAERGELILKPQKRLQVYVPNSRPVVHILSKDFGEGYSCCCCCCCCDRGKTKSTPSPKIEVWTLKTKKISESFVKEIYEKMDMG